MKIIIEKRNQFSLKKLSLEKDDPLAEHLLNSLRIDIACHLLSPKGNQWRSGYLTDDDREKLEKETGRRIRCSTESGEYFYKLD
jgi:hypothetical protein